MTLKAATPARFFLALSTHKDRERASIAHVVWAEVSGRARGHRGRRGLHDTGQRRRRPRVGVQRVSAEDIPAQDSQQGSRIRAHSATRPRLAMSARRPRRGCDACAPGFFSPKCREFALCP